MSVLVIRQEGACFPGTLVGCANCGETSLAIWNASHVECDCGARYCGVVARVGEHQLIYTGQASVPDYRTPEVRRMKRLEAKAKR